MVGWADVGLRVGFARWCRENRLRLRLTQRELAARARISRGYLAHLEAGTADPTLGLVERIAVALDVEIAWWIKPPVVHESSSVSDLVHAVARRTWTDDSPGAG